MRLIGELQTEKQVFGFQAFLKNHGIKSLYDSTPQGIYRVWVIEEDDCDKAAAYYNEWKQNPEAAFSAPNAVGPSIAEQASAPPRERSNWRVRISTPRLRSPFSLNNFIIILCGFLFILTLVQMGRLQQRHGIIALEYELVPIQQQLMFDYPAYLVNFEKFFEKYDVKTPEDLKELPPKAQASFKKIEKTPTWKGVGDMIAARNWDLLQQLPEGTLFGKIRQGEFWRLFTPVLLHGGWLHILFNMAWLFILGRQIEERIGKFRYIFLSLLLGVAGNVAQYLVSGPIFLGYSGIITGMVGFIWMRQKIAPWEGYPLQRPVIVFITVFVAAMFVLELVTMALQFFHITEAGANIANTAHIIGGVFGILLGRFSFFQRGHP